MTVEGSIREGSTQKTVVVAQLVGRAVASNTKVLRFKSSHQFYLANAQCWKDGN